MRKGMRDILGMWVQQRISAACFRCVAALRLFEASWRNPLLFFGLLENKCSIQGAFNFAMQLTITGQPRWAHRWPDRIEDAVAKAIEDTTLVPVLAKMVNEYISSYLRRNQSSSFSAYRTYRILQGLNNKDKYR
jgi:hypothetical protein